MFSPFRCLALRAPFPRLVLLLLLLHLLASSTPPLAEAKRRRSSQRSNDADEEMIPAPAGPTHLTAWERGLAGTKLSYKTLLQEGRLYYADTSERRFAADVEQEQQHSAPTTQTTTITLGYVTPWNALGYELAERFAPKFTHIAPVWYQVRKSASAGNLELAGVHDADVSWARRVRRAGLKEDHISSTNIATSRTRIVPRFILEGFEGKEAARRFLASDVLKQRCVDLIVRECASRGWDGAVFEGYAGWTYSDALQDPHTHELALDFMQHLAEALAASNNDADDKTAVSKELILAMPPPGSPHFTRMDFMRLAPYVAAFSLMTYDYSHPGRPGPCAPLPWVKRCLEELLDTPASRRSHKKRQASSGWDVNVGMTHSSGQVHEFAGKVLMGLNFYGNDFQLAPQDGGSIVGGQLLDILSRSRPKLVWDLESHEHYFDYVSSTPDGSAHRVYYPTSQSIEVRLNEARAHGAGIAIWELGQGLEHFMDLL